MRPSDCIWPYSSRLVEDVESAIPAPAYDLSPADEEASISHAFLLESGSAEATPTGRAEQASAAEPACDHHLLDLVGPLADGEDLGVPVEAADRVLLDVAIAAVNLHGLLGRPDGEPARLQLRLRRGEREASPGVLLERRLVREQPRRLDLGREVRQLRLDRLVFRDRPPEGDPLLRVRDCLVERPLGEADSHRRHADPAPVERLQELLEALPARPHDVVLRHAAVLERKRPRVGRVPAHLPVWLADLIARRAVRNEQVRDLVVARPRRDRHEAGDFGAAVGDELLRPVDHPLVAACAPLCIELGPRPRVAGVGARLGLRQAEGAEPLARAEPRHPLGLLVARSERVHGPGTERRMRRDRDRHARVDPRQLLDRDRVAEGVRAASAVLLGVWDAHQAELAQLADDRVREALLAVELLGHGAHLAVGEVAHEPPNLLLLFREVEVHAARDAIARAGRARGSMLAARWLRYLCSSPRRAPEAVDSAAEAAAASTAAGRPAAAAAIRSSS